MPRTAGRSMSAGAVASRAIRVCLKKPHQSKWPGAGAPGHRCSVDDRHGSGPGCSGGLLLVVVDLGELRVDHVLFLAGLAAGRSARTAGAARTGLAFLLRLVHRLAELHRSLRQRVGLGLDRGGVVALQRLLEIGDARSRSPCARASPTLEPCSASAFSVEWISASAWFFAST